MSHPISRNLLFLFCHLFGKHRKREESEEPPKKKTTTKKKEAERSKLAKRSLAHRFGVNRSAGVGQLCFQLLSSVLVPQCPFSVLFWGRAPLLK